MLERRLQALQLYEETPMPRWDRTDPERLDIRRRQGGPWRVPADDGRAAPPPGEAVRQALAELEQAGGTRVVHLGRRIVSRRVVPHLQQAGVIVDDLHEALGRHEALLRTHLLSRAVTPDQGKFEALHAAAWDVGNLIYVPGGVEIADPIEVVNWLPADIGGDVVCPHTLIILGERASARILESWSSVGTARAPVAAGQGVDDADAPVGPLVVGAVEVIAGPGAELDYASLQTLAEDVDAYVVRRAVLERDSRVDWVAGEFGSHLQRGEFGSVLAGQGSRSHSLLVFFGAGRQHLDLANTMVHHGGHTESDIVARGLLNDAGRGIYRAVTHVHAGARQSRSYQRGNILVLSNAARADANPSVVVEEDDVLQAGHAATVGQVDREQLFYLMSRGLPERVAIRLIVEGFLQPVIERIPIEVARDRVRTLVDRKLGV